MILTMMTDTMHESMRARGDLNEVSAAISVYCHAQIRNGRPEDE